MFLTLAAVKDGYHVGVLEPGSTLSLSLKRSTLAWWSPSAASCWAFIATSLPSTTSRAAQTSSIPPAPTGRSNR
jgi:hypothetical protein